MFLPDESLEPLWPGISVIVSPRHTFNTDTILLAWYASPRHKDRCADLGTGCGTIPLLWQGRYAPRQIAAVELQQEAVSMARRSVAYNQLEPNITVLQRDLRQLALHPDPDLQNLDLVACNPPYQQSGTGILNPDGQKQCARHETSCTLQDVCQAAARMLKYGGRFVLCQRPQRLCDVLHEFRAAKIEPKRLRFVQQNPQKPPSLFLIQGKKGAKPGLVAESVLLVEQAPGRFSQEMLEIYGSYKEGHI